MKTFCIWTVVMLEVVLLGALWLCQPVQVPTIDVTPLTTTQITEQVNKEWQERQFEKAFRVSVRMYHTYGCPTYLGKPTAEYAIAENTSVRLVTAVVIVESSCNPLAVSKAGARGLMQIMPKVHNMNPEALFHPDFNIKAGTHILAGYIRAHGMDDGLRCYFGITPGSEKSEDYADKVLRVAMIRR